MNTDTPPSNKGERNTGYKFDLLDREMADRDDYMAQMGNYDSRHEAIGMKALLERRFPEYDYEVRAFESQWRERDEPVVCGHCGREEWYMPLVAWTFVTDCDASPFCSTECYARWMYAHDRDRLEAVSERDPE